MIDPERIDMRMAIGFATSANGCEEFDIHIGPNFWLRQETIGGQNINSGMIKDYEGFDYSEKTVTSANGQIGEEVSTVLYTPNSLILPGYIRNRSYSAYALDSENLRLPKRRNIDFQLALVNEQDSHTQEQLLFDVQFLIAEGFDLKQKYVDSLTNQKSFNDPNYLLYVGLNREDEAVATTIVVNDGEMRSLWGITTYSQDQNQGYAQSMIHSVIKDSAEVFGDSPVYLLSPEPNPKAYTNLGFEKVRSYQTWWKHYPKKN